MQEVSQLTGSQAGCKNPLSIAPRSQDVLPARYRTSLMADAPVPSVVAMLICDQIIIEQGTNKKNLIGVFDNFHSLVFPANLRIAIYVKLADAQGDYLFKLRFVNLRDESLVAEIGIQAKIIDGTEPSELALNFGVPVPAEGKYEFQLYA